MTEPFIVGIDEVGRGPIAGPVCVGLVIWTLNVQVEVLKELEGIKDSKKLSEKKREEWFKKIKQLKKMGKLDFMYSMVRPSIIDKKGIVYAIQSALDNCCSRINSRANSRVKIFLDGGLRAPEQFKNQKTIVKGDEKITIISAASVVAKVVRDRRMVALARKYPEYGFERHKGYGTAEHYRMIKKFGHISEHRKSFLSS